MRYDDDDLDRPAAKTRRLVPPVDAARLQALAEAYVDRFGGPSANVRRMLDRHVHRSLRDHGGDAAALQAATQAIVQRLVEAGAIDDGRFAEHKARTLHERGTSRRLIEQRLRQRGIEGDDVRHALQELGPDPAAAELEAARALVRRRRLGPHRPPEQRAACQQKDLAALCRAGFGYDVARKALAG